MEPLEQIFKHQRALTSQFQQIELLNGLLDYLGEIPFDLTNAKAQKQVRATMGFIIEEIGEVMDGGETAEELADVCHFLVELCIFSGIGPKDIHSQGLAKLFELTSPFSHRLLVRNLALAMHCLKAKPWKMNPKPSDLESYRMHVKGAFYAFISFVKFYGFTADDLFKAYMGKAQVNQERIDGGV
jgi:hypothetical protein